MSPLRQLDLTEQDVLVAKLMATAAIRDHANRRLVLDRLDQSISARIQDESTLIAHVTHIVATCNDFPGGTDALIDAVRYFEGESRAMQEILSWRERRSGLTREASAAGADKPDASTIREGRLWHVPELPPHYLARSDGVASLVDALRVDAYRAAGIAGRHGLHGMGGIGKSVLAAAVVRNAEVRAHFVDGIYWLVVGQKPQLFSLQAALARALDVVVEFDSVADGKQKLSECLADRRILLVLDDVWEIEHATSLDVVGESGRLLITTRNQHVLTSLGAAECSLDVLSPDDARMLLARWSGQGRVPLSDDAVRVMELCGRLPLGLAMVGGMVREGLEWSEVRELLEDADLHEIAVRFPDYPYPDILAAIHVSVDALPKDLQAQFLELAIFAEDEAIPEGALSVLWALKRSKVRIAIHKLAVRSLVRRDESRQVVLHDLVHMYLRKRVVDRDGSLAVRHREFLAAYATHCPRGIGRGPCTGDDVERYFFARILYHMLGADHEHEVHALLWHYNWLDAKLRATSVMDLLADFELVECNPEMALLRDALRLSSHVLAKDPDQLPTQLVGRLRSLGRHHPAISRLLFLLETTAEQAWLCPQTTSLTSPGGSLLRTLEGHHHWVRAVASSADGAFALSGSADESVRLWNLLTGQLVRTFHEHTDQVMAVALDVNGMRALSGSKDGTARLWNILTGELVHTFKGHADEVRAISFSKDGDLALTGSSDHTVKLWNTVTGEEVRTLHGHTQPVTAVALGNDGTRALSGSLDRTLRLWDASTGELLHTLEGHADGVSCVALRADGQQAISGSLDGVLISWNLVTGEPFTTLEAHVDSVWSVALGTGGTLAISASSDGTLKLWSLVDGQRLRTLSGHSDWVLSVALAANDTQVLSGSRDRTVKLWDLHSEKRDRESGGHVDSILSVAISIDGTQILSGSADATIKLWSASSGSPTALLEGHVGSVTAVACAGQRAISGSSDRTVKLWDLENRQLLHTFEGHTDQVNAVAFAAHRMHAYSGSMDRTVRIWDVRTGRHERTLEGHLDGVMAVACSDKSTQLLSGSMDGTMRLWDTITGETIRTFEGHTDSIWAVAFSADGTLALSGSRDRTIRLWDVATGRVQRLLEGHTHDVRDVAFSTDHGLVLSGSSDRTVKLWHLESGRCVLSFVNDASVRACAMADVEPPLIIAGDRAGEIHLLRLLNQHALRSAVRVDRANHVTLSEGLQFAHTLDERSRGSRPSARRSATPTGGRVDRTGTFIVGTSVMVGSSMSRHRFLEACLVVVYGHHDLGKRVALDQPEYIVGRAETVDICINHYSVSRQHCRLSNTGTSVILQDLDSTNGTFVNDRMVSMHVLRSGDLVKVGGLIFRFLSGDNIESAYQNEVTRLTTIDGLTHVCNKRFFLEAIEREMGRAHRYRRDLSLVMLDIDHFERINKTYGNLAGDHLLKQLASMIKSCARREDVLARYGSDEFGLVLPEVDRNRAVQLAKEMLLATEQSSFAFTGTVIPLTISIGVATLGPNDYEPQAFIMKADERLRRAKDAGGNCVMGN